MPSLAAARNSNAAFCPTYIPVAIFVGGTRGIGQAMAETFARYTNGRAHVIIIGRNRTAGESIIASFPKPAVSEDGWKHEFVPCNVQLMKNVHETTRTLLKRVSKVNFLVLSTGLTSLAGREETEEGIDKKLATTYYSRWAFINDLLPALHNATEVGQPGRVMTVLGAGYAPKVDLEDLGLKKTYTGWKSSMQSGSYNDLMVAEYARQEPDIAFTHIYPGTVNTPNLLVEHWIMKLVAILIRPFVLLFGIPPHDCADYMLFALLDGENGMFRRNSKGDDLGMASYCGTLEEQKRLWEHTVDLLTRVKTPIS